MSKDNIEAHLLSPNYSESPQLQKKNEHNVFTRLCYIVVGLLLLILFVENFIFSKNLGLLGFREIDDVAFQAVIRKVHLLIFNGEYSQLFAINDYAYGWIYWMPMALITYPLYLLSMYSHIDWPLIVVPRQISLVFAILSLVFLRKILRKIDVPEWGCAAAILIFTLFPTLGFFSLRFGTVNAVMFFSLLSFYLVQKYDPSTSKSRLLVFLALAVAGGIKLSGLLIAPLILMMMLVRLNTKSIFQIIWKMILPSLVFISTLLIFTNPALVTFPFNANVGIDYWHILQHYIEVTKIQLGSSNPFERFYSGVFGTSANALAILILSLGFLIHWTQNKKARFEITAIWLTMVLISSYLILSVNNMYGAGAYFTAVSFLIVLGVVGWVHTRIGFRVLMMVIILLIVNTIIRMQYQYVLVGTDVVPWNLFGYFIKYEKSKSAVDNAKYINQCTNVASNKEWSGQLFVDHTMPLLINTLSHPNSCVSIAWDNLSPKGKYCGRPVDFIILDKSSKGALPQVDFAKILLDTDPKLRDSLLDDRASRIALNKTGLFDNQSFGLICQNSRVQIFKAIH